MARFPSHRAPSAADLRDELAFQPPGPNAPLEEWGATDIAIHDGQASCSLSGRAFIAMGSKFPVPGSQFQMGKSHNLELGTGNLELTHIRLVAVQPYMEELARCPLLARLRRLDLSGNRIGEAGVRVLASSPHLGALQELGLAKNNLGDATWEVLRSAPWFGRLRILELADNHFTACDLSESSLKELDLSRNPLATEMALPTGLKRLALSGSGLGNAMHLPLGAASRLTHLDLSFNEIDDAALECEFPALEVLNLAGNRLTAAGAAMLADSPALAALQELNLTANPIGDAGALTLVRSEWLGSLRRLNLTNCGIGDGGVKRLAASGALGGLELLSLAWNPIGDAGIRALAACPDIAGLRHLDVTGTRLGFAAAIALAESPHLRPGAVQFGNNPRLPAEQAAL